MSREVKRFCNNGTENSNTQKSKKKTHQKNRNNFKTDTNMNEFHHQKADASIMCQSDLCNFDFIAGGFSITEVSTSLLIALIALFYH